MKTDSVTLDHNKYIFDHKESPQINLYTPKTSTTIHHHHYHLLLKSTFTLNPQQPSPSPSFLPTSSTNTNLHHHQHHTTNRVTYRQKIQAWREGERMTQTKHTQNQAIETSLMCQRNKLKAEIFSPFQSTLNHGAFSWTLFQHL